MSEPTFDEAFPDLLRRATSAAAAVLGRGADSEDVAAETMHRALVRWTELDPRGRRSWTGRVATNLAIDTARKRRTEPERDAPVEGHETSIIRRLDLTDGLAQLTARQREVVVLRHLSGFSESEIAEMLGVSPNSVKTHLQRGLKTLRAHLGVEMPIVTPTRRTPMATTHTRERTITAERHPLGRLLDPRTIRYERDFPLAASEVWNQIAGSVDADAPDWAIWSDGTPAAALGAWLIPTPTRLEPVIGGRFWFGAPDDLFHGVVADIADQRHMLLNHHDGSGMLFTVRDVDAASTRFSFTHWFRSAPPEAAPENKPAGRADEPWSYAPLGAGTYLPALAAAWHASLYNLDRLLGAQDVGDEPAPEPGPTTQSEFPAPDHPLYRAYRTAVEDWDA